MEEYIKVGKLNHNKLKELNIKLITDEVVFTFERIERVKDRRVLLYEEVKDILPTAIYDPDYIYEDWNNRNNTLVLIKNIDKKAKIDVVIKIAVINDEKHTKNSIITMIKIGNKTFKKIYKNKRKNLLFEKLDKDE